jgi:hypothetical protein
MGTSTPMVVRADQVQLRDVVVFEAPYPDNTVLQVGTVFQLTLIGDDVTIQFYGPQMVEREVTTSQNNEVAIVRMER